MFLGMFDFKKAKSKALLYTHGLMIHSHKQISTYYLTGEFLTANVSKTSQKINIMPQAEKLRETLS